MRILLYVDDSPYWHDAAALVARFARKDRAHVTILSTAWLQMHRTRALREARALLGLPAERVSEVERPGLVEYVLPEVAKEDASDLVVVGRLGSLDRLTNGLVGILLVKRTPASVLLVRPNLERVKSILVCTEGPVRGMTNVRLALRAAKAFDARLTVLHVASQMGITQRASAELAEGLLDLPTGESPEATHLRAAKEEMDRSHVKGRVKVRKGLVVDEILDEVADGGHDLLVIGAHATDGKEALLYEDLASLIVRSSPVSTLVIRPPRDPSRPVAHTPPH